MGSLANSLPPYSVAVLLWALRSTLFLTDLPKWLRTDEQLSSPLTSYMRLSEGVFLFKLGFDPYAGGIFRHSPLQLAVFSTAIPLEPLSSALVWSISDAVALLCLLGIFRLRHKSLRSSQEAIVSAAYLLHPYLALPTLALSTSSLDNSLHLLSLYFASAGNAPAALLTLAFLTCSSLPSLLYLPPMIFLLLRGPTANLTQRDAGPVNWKRATRLAGVFAIYLSLLVGLQSFISGGFHWIERTWGAVLTLPDLTPNPGLWWYFFTEMFDHFRPFFLMVFTAHLIIYVAPLTIRLNHDPLFALFILQGIIAMLKSYPTLSDPGLFTAMYALFPEIQSELRWPLPTAMLHLHSGLLLPLFHHLWIGAGTGNANFFYASTLVFGLANGASIIDALRAGLRLGYGKRGEGWELVQL